VKRSTAVAAALVFALLAGAAIFLVYRGPARPPEEGRAPPRAAASGPGRGVERARTLQPDVPPAGLQGRIFLGRAPAAAAGATVSLFLAGTREPERTAITGADGGYEFQGLEPGSYWLLAWKDGWSMRLPPVDEEWTEVRPGETASAERVLVKGAVITGWVVEKDARGPIADAGISFGLLAASTDGEGRFQLPGVPPGNVNLTVEAEGFGSRLFELEAAPGEAPSLLLELERGETMEGAQGFTAYGPEQDQTEDAGDAGEPEAHRPQGAHSLGGTVVDQAGKPVEDALVSISVGSWTGLREPPVSTDGEGRFAFHHLPEEIPGISASRIGSLEAALAQPSVDRDDLELVLEEGGVVRGVVVDKASGAPLTNFVITLLPEGREFFPADGRFTLRGKFRPGDSLNLLVLSNDHQEVKLENLIAWRASEGRPDFRIELPRGESLSGKVVSAATGRGLPAVQVSCVTGSPMGDLTRTATSGPDGVFVIQGLSDEPGTLRLEKAGYASLQVEALPGPQLQLFPMEVEAFLEGALTSASGEPVSGADVEVSNEDDRVIGSFRTGSDGRYRIEGLPPGSVEVHISRSGALDMSRKVALAAGKTTTADFTESRGAISGRVTSRKEDGVPLPITIRLFSFGAHPAAFLSSGPEWTFAAITWIENQELGFRFENVVPGRYWLHASSESAGTRLSGDPGPIEFSEETALDGLEIPLEETGALTVTVLDRKTAQPIENAAIDLRLEPGIPIFERDEQPATDGSGQSTISGLHPGRYLLRVTADRHLAQEEKLSFTGGAAALTVSLPPLPGS
jgi:protocatechuate 3,4-dioxygenase beta subunit